jgi:hypothetical protein
LDCHEGGRPGDTLAVFIESEHQGGPLTCCMLDSISVEGKSTSASLARRGSTSISSPSRPGVESLRLVHRIDEVHGEPVCAVVESMTGGRLIHDTLEQEGWSVEIADAQKVKGLAPLACKTDKIDSLVLATLSQRDLVEVSSGVVLFRGLWSAINAVLRANGRRSARRSVSRLRRQKPLSATYRPGTGLSMQLGASCRAVAWRWHAGPFARLRACPGSGATLSMEE